MKQSRIYGVCLMLVLAVLGWANIGTAAAEGRPFITQWEGYSSETLKIPIVGQYKISIRHAGYYSYLGLVKEEEVYIRPGECYEFTPPFHGEYQVEAGPEGVRYIRMSDGSHNRLLKVRSWGDVKWETMEKAFSGCENMTIDKNLRIPNLSQVTNMNMMFYHCTEFNSPLNEWDVSSVTNMRGMFRHCTSFNQPLDNWNVSLVTDMEDMFWDCRSFNQSLNNWNVGRVTNMRMMFRECFSFNQPLDNWNVSRVSSMSDMFYDCKKFNQPLNNWNVSQVTEMVRMFEGCISFNQPLGNWNVNNVTSMYSIFKGCYSFNQNLGNWNLTKCTNLEEGFDQCGMDIDNYTRTLQGWAASGVSKPQDAKLEVGVRGLKYVCEAAHKDLTDRGWLFQGDALEPSYIGVHIHPSTLVLEAGKKQKLALEVITKEGNDTGVTWSSAAPGIAQVDETTGEVCGISPGKTIIRAISNFNANKYGKCDITVRGVKKVSVQPAEITLLAGKKQKLTAEVEVFGDNVGKDVTWTSNKPQIARVDATTGEVTAVTCGEAIVTATSNFDKTKKASCTVAVADITTLEVAPATLTLLPNDTHDLTARVEVVGDVSKEVTWSSNATGVARVDATSGRVTAVATGVAVITATSKADESKKATCTVTVKGVTGITLSESSKTIKKGSKAFLTASVTGVGDINSKVKWSSSDPNIVAVNEDTGEISNSGEWISVPENYHLRIWNVGEVTVTATSIEDPTKSATCNVTVTGIKKFGIQGAIPAVSPVRKGETAGPFSVVIEVVGECSKAVTWSSSDSDVITVDPSTGKYCAVKAGLAQLSAKNSEGESITFPMVVPGITSVEARPSDLTLRKGEKKQIEILLNTLDERGEMSQVYALRDNIILYSEDRRIAELVEPQQVLGISTGRTRIRATSEEDPSRVGYCNVEVEGVVSVAISPVTKILNAGEQLTLSATVDAIGAVSREVSWSGDNSAVATVDSKTGKVTAVGVGEVEITARSREDHSKSATVKVQVAGVRSVSLSVATLLLQNQGETRDLKATVNVLGTVDKGVKWSSNNPSVATVDPVTGKVTAVATGHARITATSKVDATKSATCQVSVAGVEMVSVIPETLTLNRHAGTALQAIVSTIGEAQKTVTWASDHPEVVTVDPTSGRVTANGAGEATITATSTSNKTKSGSCKVTVKGVRRVTVEPIALELLVGQSDKTLVATVEVFGDVSDRVTWSSNHPEIAAVRPASGEVTGKGIGSAILTATSVADPTQKATVAVEVGGVQKVTVTAPQPSLKVGETITLTAQVEVFGNVSQTVTWSTNKAQVATVDPSSGAVTAVATGSVIITATSMVDITKKASCTLEVTAAAPKPEKIPVVAIVVTPNVKTLTVGEKVTLSATVAPAEATEQGYTWRSENTNIAEVSATGEVTAKGVGSCKIYAKSNETGSMVEGFCQVTVNAEDVPVVKVVAIVVTPNVKTLTVGEKVTLSATVAPVEATEQGYTWRSEDANIAEVSATGEVTAKGVGTCKIYAKSNETGSTVEGFCQVTVNAADVPVVKVVAIVVTPNMKTLTVGEKVTLSATVAPADATEQGYTWRSEDANIVEVSATGEVTAKGVGTCKIYAKSNETGSTVEGFCQVTVNAASNNPGGGNPGGNNNWQPQTPQAVEDAALATLVIAPNPFTTQLRIGNPAGVTAWYELVNVTGVVLRSGVVEGNEVMVDTEGLPAGVYFVRLSHQNGVQRTEKVFHY